MNYYIQGSPARAKEIKAAFEKLGYNTGNLGFTSSQLYFTIEGKVELICTKALQNLIKTHPDYKELPKPHYDTSNFKPFQKVLVRDSYRDKWRCAWFSDYDKTLPYSFVTTGADFKQCIPFEGSEHLLGTTDMCDEQYINW